MTGRFIFFCGKKKTRCISPLLTLYNTIQKLYNIGVKTRGTPRNHCRVFNLWHDAAGDWETWGFGAAHFPEILEDLGTPEEPIIDE